RSDWRVMHSFWLLLGEAACPEGQRSSFVVVGAKSATDAAGFSTVRRCAAFGGELVYRRWRDVRFGARSPHGLHMFCNRLPDPSRLLLCLAVGDQSRAVRPGRRLIPGVPGISGYRESAVG